MSVWQLAVKLLTVIYKITNEYPESEKFGLVSDMRRAANSICHNVAEGYGRFEARDKTRCYKIARGSSYELISQLTVSAVLGYISESESDQHIVENKQIIKELDSLINAVENRS